MENNEGRHVILTCCFYMHSHNYSPAYIQAIHTHTVDYTVLINRIFVWRNGHMDSRLKGTQVIFHEADSF